MSQPMTRAEAREVLGLLDSFLTFVAGGSGTETEILRRKKPKTKKLRAIEKAMRDDLQAAWLDAGEKARDHVLGILSAGSGDLTAAELDAALATMGNALGPSLSSALSSRVDEFVAEAYDLGRKALVPKPSFNLVDTAAKNWLGENQTYWIGEHYGAEVGPRIAATVQTEIIEKGLGRADAGEALQQIFEPEFGPRSESYWQGLAASAASRSHNFGAVESMVEAEFTELEIVAVMDEATSEICREMNGKVFRVDWAVKQRDSMMAAETPEDAKAAAPWPKIEDVQGKAEEELAKRNICLPPYHFHCRTTVVVR